MVLSSTLRVVVICCEAGAASLLPSKETSVLFCSFYSVKAFPPVLGGVRFALRCVDMVPVIEEIVGVLRFNATLWPKLAVTLWPTRPSAKWEGAFSTCVVMTALGICLGLFTVPCVTVRVA